MDRVGSGDAPKKARVVSGGGPKGTPSDAREGSPKAPANGPATVEERPGEDLRGGAAQKGPGPTPVGAPSETPSEGPSQNPSAGAGERFAEELSAGGPAAPGVGAADGAGAAGATPEALKAAAAGAVKGSAGLGAGPADPGGSPAAKGAPAKKGPDKDPVKDGPGKDPGKDGPDKGPAGPGGPLGGPVPGAPKKGGRGVADAVKRKLAMTGMGAAGKAGLLVYLVHAVKTFLLNAFSGLVSAVQSIVSGGIIGFLQSVGGAIAGALSAVAGFFAGLSAPTVVCGVAVAATVATAGAVVAAAPMVDDDPCFAVADVARIRAAQESETGEADGPAESEEAYGLVVDKLAGILKGKGLSDNAVAGVIGNVAAECGFDFSQVEGIYTEWGHVGPGKQKALDDIDAHTRWLFSDYESKGWSLDKPTYFSQEDGKYWPALGFCSWTGGQAYRLCARAREAGADWWDADFQIAYYLAYGTAETTGRYPNGKEFLSAYAQWSEGKSVEECVEWYLDNFHGQSMSNRGDVRLDRARHWLDRIKGAAAADMSLKAQNYYGKVIASLGSDAVLDSVAKATEHDPAAAVCVKGADKALDSEGAVAIAQLAVKWALPTREEAEKSDGKEEYRKAHDAKQTPDVLYKDCGAFVGTCVLTSGADTTYPPCATDKQLPYLETSDKWEKVCDLAAPTDLNLLMPGDILIAPKPDGLAFGHTAVYCGRGLVSTIEGADVNADIVQASYGAFSPCAGSAAGFLNTAYSYEAYRCVKPDNGGATDASGALSQDMAGASGTQRAIVDAAGRQETTDEGWCAQWVSNVYRAAGLGYPGGNACDMYWEWCKSSNRADLKPGMIVAVPSHPHTAAGRSVGHVGVYIGNGMVRHSIGYVETKSLDDWIAYYGATNTVRWGFATSRPVD